MDHRTDIYSLGATLYELLTLTLPFGGDTTAELLSRILLEDPVPPRRLDRAVPRDLSVICQKAIEKQPGRRFQSAAEFADDLRRWMGHETIRARPPSVFSRARKWAKRHPAVAATAVLVPLALMLTGWFARESVLASRRVTDLEGEQVKQSQRLRHVERARYFGELSEAYRTGKSSPGSVRERPPGPYTFEERLILSRNDVYRGRLEFDAAINAMAATRDGRYAAFGLANGSVVLHDLEREREVWRLDDLGEEPSSIEFAPDGRSLLVIGKEGLIHDIEAVSARAVERVVDIKNRPRSASFRSDGQRLALQSSHQVVVVDLKDWRTWCKITFEHYGVQSAKYRPSTSEIYVAHGGRVRRFSDDRSRLI
ncbi:MAG: hypothetical protein AAF658_15555, partial [Myxococcota bacterium]